MPTSAHDASSAGRCSVRKATAGDVDAVARIWHTGWNDGHLGHVPPGLLPYRTAEHFESRARERIDSMWVAESDGRAREGGGAAEGLRTGVMLTARRP
jgi:hypothetical protein